MSGICGIVRLDGGKVDPAEIEVMTTVLERRGPDGTHHWADGPVALGHTLLVTTPEALAERLPLTDPTSGCTITADVRLDNREELLPALGLDGERRIVGDGELILRAYLEWGEDCPMHLLGDFAFAIWDPRSRQLFCARDHMGMRQFNYCQLPGQLFVFSTEDTGVREHPSVPRTLDEGRIADFIDDLEGFDFTSTFFESVHRLPPAHSMVASSNGLELRRYWSLRPGPMLKLASDEAYVDAFLAKFTEAVRCRLRSARPVGTMLSGGLDSSAVTAVASRILADAGQGPLTTVSAISSDPSQCPETQAIRTALLIDGVRPIFVSLSDFGGMCDELLSAFKDVRNPFELHGTMLRCIYGAASKNGINVLLDGGAGDVILSSDNRVGSMLAAHQYKRAFRELVDETAFWKVAKPHIYVSVNFLRAAWSAFAPVKIRAGWRHLRATHRIRGARLKFARQVRFAERRQLANRHLTLTGPLDRGRRAEAIRHPNLVSGRERFDQLAAWAGVECRDPFMDIRLIDFCLALPADQLHAGGWPKAILRRAAEKLLPREIAWRQGKEHLGWAFTKALLARWEEWPENMRDPASPLSGYLSRSALRNLRQRPITEPTGMGVTFFALDRFLRRYGGGRAGLSDRPTDGIAL